MPDKLILVSEKRLRELVEHERDILKYCEKNLDYMWAATIAGIILECDFRDAKVAYDKYKSLMGQRE
jgi:hypothetical protein